MSLDIIVPVSIRKFRFCAPPRKEEAYTAEMGCNNCKFNAKSRSQSIQVMLPDYVSTSSQQSASLCLLGQCSIALGHRVLASRAFLFPFSSISSFSTLPCSVLPLNISRKSIIWAIKKRKNRHSIIMPLQVNGIQAWITVENKVQVQEYAPEIDQATGVATCWIGAEPGQVRYYSRYDQCNRGCKRSDPHIRLSLRSRKLHTVASVFASVFF